MDEENLTEEATLEANIARDRLARLSTLVTEIVDQMTPDIDELSLKDGCMQLVRISLPYYIYMYTYCLSLLNVILDWSV